MALILEYTNTREDFLAQAELIHRDSYRSARSAHYQSVVFWSGMLALAAYASVLADNIFLVCVFLVALGWHLYQSIPYARLYRRALENSLRSRSEPQIRLEVKDDGLYETVDGIEGFAPWSSVKSYVLFRDILFIALSANLWAIIPQRSISSTSASLDDLIRILRDRGVKDSRGD